MIARVKVRLSTRYPQSGWVEHDAQELLSSQLHVLEKLLAQIPSGVKPVSMGIAAQRSTIILWDRKTGEALVPAISWQDGRAAHELQETNLEESVVFFKTGLFKAHYYSAPKIRWCLKNVPAVASALAEGRLAAGPVTSFILWHLTKGEVFAVDPTMAQRTLLFNVESFQWDAELLKAFAIPREILPDIVPTTGNIGEFVTNGVRIPIQAAIGDQQAVMSGVGAGSENMAAVNYGTGAFLLLNTGNRLHRVPGLLSSIGGLDSDGNRSYLLEGTVNSAATMLRWLKEGAGMFQSPGTVDEICGRAHSRVFVLPAIGGMGAPHWDYQTFTTITGLTGESKQEDIIRGAVDGIAFLIADIACLLREKGLPVSELRASGGLSRIDYLLQFQSDILQVPVLRMAESETTALGVARLLAKHNGLEMEKIGVDRKFEPGLDKQQAGALLKKWKSFVSNCKTMSAELK